MVRARPAPGGVGFAFTLIELLTVITIIAILAALLIPGAIRAKDSANSAKCVSNLRQIGMAFDMYGQQFQYYPWSWEAPAFGNSHWAFRITPMLWKFGGVTYSAGSSNLSAVVQCPGRKFPSPPGFEIVHYSVNPQIFGSNDPFTSYALYPRKYSYDRRNTELILAADGTQDPSAGWAYASFANYAEVYQAYNPTTAENAVNAGPNIDDAAAMHYIRFRHGGNARANCVFLDGHVQSISVTELREKHLKVEAPIHIP